MERPLRIYQSPHHSTWWAWVYKDHVRVILQDGYETRGYPPSTDVFKLSAVALGYGDDVYWHMVEHDLIHCLLAEFVDGRPPAALWNQAHDPKAYLKKMPKCVERDEYRVGAMQAALNNIDWGIHRCMELSINGCISPIERVLRPQGECMTREWANNAQPADIKLPYGWGA